jgi:hypothetical protein
MVFDAEWGVLKSKQRTMSALAHAGEIIVWHQHIVSRSIGNRAMKKRVKRSTDKNTSKKSKFDKN